MQETLGKRFQWEREKDWESIQFKSRKTPIYCDGIRKTSVFKKEKLFESVRRHVQR
jgi:hypothetical protein